MLTSECGAMNALAWKMRVGVVGESKSELGGGAVVTAFGKCVMQTAVSNHPDSMLRWRQLESRIK
jgi:hypothetical protein